MAMPFSENIVSEIYSLYRDKVRLQLFKGVCDEEYCLHHQMVGNGGIKRVRT
jgi:hypothetical protein